jgi:glycosyltransferase involved in cell wall biosynthesis
MNDVIRVGFFLHQTNWNGGINYISNLVAAIISSKSKKVEPKIFVGKKFNGELPFLEKVYIKTSLLDRWSILWILDQILQRLGFGRDLILFLLLKKNKIDIVSHAPPIKAWYRIPSISWVADFQHLHNKNFFDIEEINNRNEGIQHLINHSDAIILSSNHALNDLKNNFNFVRELHAYVLHFYSVLMEKTSNVASKIELIKKYRLSSSWFYMPNQFWAHKNHKLVIQALKLVRDSGLNISIVSSGITEDYRNPEYFSEILELVHETGVEKHFHILGSIPYCDVVGLMRASIAVINPSLFEGWSTSVEEARSLGKKVLLSNIPVHVEQDPPGAVYFDRFDCSDLARCMKEVYEEYIKVNLASPEPSVVYLGNFERILRFSEAYEAIVFDVYARSRVG